MNFLPGHIYHVYNQGNNKQDIFHDEDDYHCFLSLTRNNLLPCTDIIAYCLMPNHFHFQVATDERCNTLINQGNLILDPVTNGIRKLLSSYAKIHNKKYFKTGSLFRQKTKSKQLSSDHLLTPNTNSRDYYLNCFHYLHQNPLQAGLVEKLEDWTYSSFRDYAGLRTDAFINKVKAAEICGFKPDRFIYESYQLIDNF